MDGTEYLQNIFKIISQNNNTISPNQLFGFLSAIDNNITQSDVDSVINNYDLNGDGSLDFNEFKAAINPFISLSDVENSYSYLSEYNLNKFFNLMNIESLPNIDLSDYISLILKMVGPGLTTYIDLWNHLTN